MMSNKRLEIRSGYTLIEILLAVTLGLILMLGVVQMFAMVSNFVTNSQGLMELDQKVRSAQITLQNDLTRYTAKMTVPSDANSGAGYFRIDENSSGAATSLDTRLSNFYSSLTGVVGDNDDVLTFTIHDLDSPFIGRNGTTVVHSQDAEVKWFVYYDTVEKTYALYRAINVLDPTGAPSATATGNIKHASLSDLAFSPGSGGGGGRGRVGTAETNYRFTTETTNKTGAELILDNIIIFDVKVWDPEAPVPTDATKKGAFVDLGKGTTFSAARGNSFDTGNQFKYAPTNLATVTETGADNTNNKVINAPNPSNFSLSNAKMAGITLQGIQIHVRTFDPTSGIIRDFTVEQEFVSH